MTIRPASEIRAEIDNYRKEKRQREIEAQKKQIAQKIETYMHARYISVLVPMKEVQEELRLKGYEVTINGAAHMGDIESMTIRW